MIAAPLLMLAGVLLRIRFNFFFPHQLSAFQQHPTLITAAYSCFLAGNILLWPAIVALAHLLRLDRIGYRRVAFRHTRPGPLHCTGVDVGAHDGRVEG